MVIKTRKEGIADTLGGLVNGGVDKSFLQILGRRKEPTLPASLALRALSLLEAGGRLVSFRIASKIGDDYVTTVGLGEESCELRSSIPLLPSALKASYPEMQYIDFLRNYLSMNK